MTLIGFTGTPTQNGVVTVGNNEATPLLTDSFLDEFTKASESRISEPTTTSSLLPTQIVVTISPAVHFEVIIKLW